MGTLGARVVLKRVALRPYDVSCDPELWTCALVGLREHACTRTCSPELGTCALIGLWAGGAKESLTREWGA